MSASMNCTVNGLIDPDDLRMCEECHAVVPEQWLWVHYEWHRQAND